MRQSLKTLFCLLSLSALITSCEEDSKGSSNNGGNQTPQAEVAWNETVVINNEPVLNYAGDSLHGPDLDARARYGSQYGRLLKLNDGSWLAAYTISSNYGYNIEENGGYRLEVAKSTDGGASWTPISLITDPGRDLDNAQMLQLADGSIALACRSVRWQESYRLPVYKSYNNGASWTYVSTIDANEGTPGQLGSPDKGVYEPHLLLLNDGRLAVMYANEKHVTDAVSYSQIISEKISADAGQTWGDEIWAAYEPGKNSSRPGMPVWTKMGNNKYILFYEICGPEACNIFYKMSDDGINWPVGHGISLANQSGAPYVLSMDDGTLVVTSNRANVSTSIDFGATWQQTGRAWQHAVSYEQDWTQTVWSSIYQFEPNKIGTVTSVKRTEGGSNIKIRYGNVSRE